jgi:DNA-binding beta-propeller fold protein YncE
VFGPKDGHLYVESYASSSETSAILRYDGRTGAFLNTFVPAESIGRNIAEGLVFGPADGHLYVNVNDRVKRYDGQTGRFLDELVPTGALASTIFGSGLAFGPDGHLYVSDDFGDKVLRYDVKRGVFLDVFVPSETGGLNIAQGLVFGPDRHLYVSSYGSNAILRYDGQTGVLLNAFVPDARGNGLMQPTGLVFGPDGHLYVSSWRTNEIMRFEGRTGAPLPASIPPGGAVFVLAGSGGLKEPMGLVFGPDNDLYVSSSGSNAILRYDRQTGRFRDAFVPPGSGGLQQPTGLVFDRVNKNLYVSSSGSNAILRYDGQTGTPLPAPGASGAVFVPAGSGGLRGRGIGFSGLQGLVFGPDDHLYVSSPGSDQIIRYDGRTGAFLNVFVLSSRGLGGPLGLVFFTP